MRISDWSSDVCSSDLNTEAQVQAMAHFRPDGYAGTPDFLKIILDKAAETGADLSSCRKALVSGGALFPSLRREYADRGVRVLQCYGIADLGLVARSEEHTSELQSLMRISYAVFCLKKKKENK